MYAFLNQNKSNYLSMYFKHLMRSKGPYICYALAGLELRVSLSF